MIIGIRIGLIKDTMHIKNTIRIDFVKSLSYCLSIKQAVIKYNILNTNQITFVAETLKDVQTPPYVDKGELMQI